MSEALPVLQPMDMVRCDHFNAQLMARACLGRQRQRRRHRVTGNVKIAHEFCGSGKCDQGRGYAERLTETLDPEAIDSLAFGFGRRRKRKTTTT